MTVEWQGLLCVTVEWQGLLCVTVEWQGLLCATVEWQGLLCATVQWLTRRRSMLWKHALFSPSCGTRPGRRREQRLEAISGGLPQT